MDNFTIAVTIGSREVRVTSNGTEDGTSFEGEIGDVKTAIESAKRKDSISFGKFGEAPIANAGFESPIALAAALYSINPEIARLIEAPKEAYEFLVFPSESNAMKPVGIYPEVAISTFISFVGIIYWFMMIRGLVGFVEVIPVNIIAIIATPLAMYCLVISIIKLFTNNDFSTGSYPFVVLFLGLLPFIFLFMPSIGFVPQLIDSWDGSSSYGFSDNSYYENQGAWKE